MARTRRTSARVRLFLTSLALVGVALLVTIALLRQVLLRQLDDRVDRSLVQEAEEITEFAASSTPEPGEDPATFARRVLTEYLATNVADDQESLVAVQDGIAFLRSAGAPGDVSGQVAEFAATTRPRFVELDTDAGPARVLAQPILDGERQVGLLAIAWFTAAERELVERTIRDAVAVAAAAFVAAAALAWVATGRIMRPVILLADTARDITEHDLHQRIPVEGSAEVASLIVSFNTMLDRLEQVVGTQRTFLDDAGHELRTPITIIRGHLELAGDDPERFAASRTVVMAELDRMSRIVGDLLTLAKAEQVDLLARRPVDVDELVTDLRDRMRHLGPQQIEVDALAAGVVQLDPDRITQAVLNLAANAVRHTPPDGTVAIGSRFTDDSFEIWVRDTGEGIDPSDHEAIFERFRRSPGQRSPGGSAGLGLSIVRLVARAHGGDVRVDSAPGEGATFTISIPADPIPHEPEQTWHES
ncbi:MAG: HAMP domain-containing histidine kinase [Ilumatobacteraceae bacterium]|nr:HAMP domain-containing histidine kinase [Ilumatobacteraceae bacterium]